MLNRPGSMRALLFGIFKRRRAIANAYNILTENNLDILAEDGTKITTES